MKKADFLRSVHVKNYKSIRDSKVVKLTPLTVLNGNNGSGKSSLVEALETYRLTVTSGLDEAMGRWLGIEHILNKKVRQTADKSGFFTSHIQLEMAGRQSGKNVRWGMNIASHIKFNSIRIDKEWLNGQPFNYKSGLSGGQSMLPEPMHAMVANWQFLSLVPESMSLPFPKRMTAAGRLLLNRDGSNLAQYLLNIRKRDRATFEGIVQTMTFVLDYAANFEPVETSEVQRTMYVQMRERDFAIPGWMLSTGTLRILAFLTVLRNPDPPPLIVIEEIENGLDPRTLSLLIDEIRDAVRSGRTQVIATTHSPYLLDLLPLQTIVLVERDNHGNPSFHRPASNEQVKDWSTRFTNGKLYTAGQLSSRVVS